MAQASPLCAVISKTSKRVIRNTAVTQVPSDFDGAALSLNSVSWAWSTGSFTGIDGFHLHSSSTTDTITLSSSACSYVDSGLGINRSVTRWLTAYSGPDEGSDSQHIEKYTYANPPATFTLSTVTANSAYLTWQYSTATAYAIEGSTDGGATYYRIREAFVPWQTVNLMSNRHYKLRLGAINGEDVVNPFSYSVEQTTTTPPLNMPMYGVALSSGIIVWHWDVSEVGSSGVTLYRIYKSTLTADGGTPDVMDTGVIVTTITDVSVNSWTEFFADDSSGTAADSRHTRWIKAQGILESTGTMCAYKYTYAIAPSTCGAKDPSYQHVGTNSVDLDWNSSPAHGYVVERSTTGYFTVSYTSGTSGEMTTGLISNTKYDFRLHSYNGDHELTPENALNTLGMSAPYRMITRPLPTDHTCAAVTDTSIRWSWSTGTYTNVRYIDGYWIGIDSITEDGHHWEVVANIPGVATNEYVLDYLLTNSTHMRAVGANQTDPDWASHGYATEWYYENFGSEAYGTTCATFATPPNDVAIDTVGARSLKMWWAEPQVPATKYRVQRSTSTGELGPWTLIADVTTYYFEDTGLQPSTTYSYRIGAVNKLGVPTVGLGAATGGNRRDYSFVSSTITRHVAPVIYGVATGTSSINWAWTDTVPGVTAYNLYASSGQAVQLGISGSTTFYSEVNISSANARLFRRLRSVAPDGEGDYTDAAVSTLANPPAAAAAAARGLHTASLGWTSNGSARYGVYRSSDGLTWTGLNNWSSALSSGPYVEAGLHYGTTFYYAVRGYNDDAIVSVSSAVSAAIMTAALPAAYTAVYSTASSAISSTAPLTGLGQITVTLPAGSPDGYFTISTGAYLSPSEVTKANLDAAIARLSGEALLVNSISELHYYDVYGAPVTSALPSPARLTITYVDANADGIVDGSSPQMQVPTLKLFTLDDTALVWNQIRESTLNRSGSAVYADIPHFSLYALGSVTSAAGAINQVFAYPNPYRPGSSGLFGQSSLGEGIVFESLPAGAKIKIYTLYGAEAASLSDDDGDGRVLWNTKTKDGSKAASGVYMYIVSSASGKKTGKVVIIR